MRIGVKIILTALLVLSAMNAYAWELKDGNDELFQFNGQILYRGRYYNLDFNDDSSRGHINRHNYFGDLSLKFLLKPEQHVTLFFEMHKFVFEGQRFRYNSIQTGEEVAPEEMATLLSSTSGVSDPNNPTAADIAKLPLRPTNTDEAWEMHLRQAWMDVKLPRYPVKLKFGRQPFVLGNGIYSNTNIASAFGFQVYSDFGAGKSSVRLGSMKFYEGLRENYNYELKENDDPDDIDLLFADGSIPLPMEKSKAGAFLTYYKDCSKGLDELSHVNIGLTADLSLPAGFTLKSEFDYQIGTIDSSNTKTDWNGYAFMLNVGAPPVLNNKLRLSGEFGIGSGDDPDTEDFEGYVGVAPFFPYAFAYEYRFLHMIYNSSHMYTKLSKGMYENLAPGLENTTYLKANATVSLPYKASFTFSPIYLGMTEQGEAFGYEFDNTLNIPVYKNFSYMFVFAYVMPSDYMKDINPSVKDNAYAIRSQFMATF
ncbi:MAG: hypothetical protein JXB48_16760 [Candidatus Latescibacteria bacterium]|nr:hypothetical protein [Candidatus Latescibacterota bacterium]